MKSKFAGRGTRAATPRPTAGRPANEAAFNTVLDELEKRIKRAARRPHSYAVARRIWKRMDELAAQYEMDVLAMAPDYPDDETDE